MSEEIREIDAVGNQKIYKAGLGYYFFLLFATGLMLPLALLGVLIAISFGYFAYFFAAFVLVMMIWEILILVSASCLRLTLTTKGLEYRVLGYSLFAEWSDIKTIESRRYGDFVVVERCAIEGNPLFGFLCVPMMTSMNIPLSSGPIVIWEKDVVPEIIAFVQASKS